MKFLSFEMWHAFQRPGISSVFKQCFVTFGVTLNMAALGLNCGFAVPLLEQLKIPESSITIDDEEGSWIASIPGLFIFVGNFFVIPIMGKYGRRTANLVSIILLIVAWTSIVFTPNIYILLIARAFQGINIGMCTTLGALLIGEYSSPKHRGGLLTIISVFTAVGVWCSHLLGSYLTWRIDGLICAIIALINMVIVFLSPESPYWLASQGRYEECKKVFRWLRGETEEEELNKLIEACILVRSSKVKADDTESFFRKLKINMNYFKGTIIKKEFYKPVIIVSHIYTLIMFTGLCIITVYPEDYIRRISGHDVNVTFVTTTMDVQRIVSSIIGIYFIKRFRRRIILIVTVAINVAGMIAIAIYSYARVHYTLPYDNPLIGILLTHCVVFAISTGTSSLPFTIAGEIFALEDKTLAGGIGMLVFSVNLFVVLKTIPVCFDQFDIHGTFLICVLVLCYCLAVVWVLLPETKDKSLQDIEDEFRGRPLAQELQLDLSVHNATA